MKKLILLVLTICCTHFTYAAPTDTANIKINITGAINDNRYFLCLPSVGCLSIYAAEKKGKIYPLARAITMDTLFVANVADNMRLSPQGLPSSCNVTVGPKKTITISGELTTRADKSIRINNLHCSVQ